MMPSLVEGVPAMFAQPRWSWVPLALVGVLAVGAPARAAAPQVTDRGAFFKPETVEEANRLVKEIKDLFERDVVVETFADLPADRTDRAKGSDRAAFYHDWARDRAR